MVCHSKSILPTTYELIGLLLVPGNSPAYGSSCDVHKGTLTEDVCIKQLRITVSGDREKVEKVPRLLSLRLGSRQLTNPKLFCTEVIVWKRLNHRNIVPFKGVTFNPLQLISEWMPSGELRAHQGGSTRKPH